MQDLDFSVVLPYWTLLAHGAWWTAVLTIISGFLSLVLGLVFALGVLYGGKLLGWPLRLLAWIFMGTPLLLQLFLIYFGLVQIGIDVPAMVAGIVGLALHFAVYNADIFRAGLAAVDPGQAEGARSLGFSRFQTQRYIVVPQALRDTAPAVGGNLIALLKESSIVSIIGIAELVQAAQLSISETYRPFEFYLTAAAIYYVLNGFLEFALSRIEHKVELTR